MNIRYETDTLHNELIATIKKPIKVRYINTGKWAWSEHYDGFQLHLAIDCPFQPA